MKNLWILAAALVLTAPAVSAQTTTTPAAASATPISASHRKAAEELLAITGSEKNMTEMSSRMLDVQLEQRPEMKAVEPEMRAFLTKYMSWQSMKDDLVQLYAQEFTEKELKELNKFYQTPTGRKTIQKMPMLMQAGMEIGQRRVQEHLPELQKAIADKMQNQQPGAVKQ
ncbi:DUF2059 domain-containing protein [Hymenobacter taeanensis]|uniref:DUF2059 domain-containing protein n=1 Tax=Hymenobacter taeanensis TaxID=2735321 RepID=A0A6M6BEK3_9BACT|nr:MULTISPECIES: DUF2059 domain-containing protein [Hymenobacter]QJX45643.1 DUF2059 domain-containing protein [Hymenobacter taeanensis]UOQ79479.1 DUF2059 domain-containing protein [Hymenobacter sp. 5414T-23]